MNYVPQSKPLSIYIVAAEESGDALGAALASALRAREGGAQARRRRRASHGGGRNYELVRYRRPFDHRLHRNPTPPADNSAPHPRNRRRGDRRAAGCSGHHRQPGLHPPGRAPGARAERRRSRSSIMSRHRFGLGGPAARAPCAAMSIACLRSCRSSRRRMCGSAGRPASMSAIR